MKISNMSKDNKNIDHPGHYHKDSGFEVIDVNNNKTIGKIENFSNNTIHDILEVTSDCGELLIPYVDNFVKEINLHLKKIYVIKPEI